MTTHEADRPADYDSVEEEDEVGGRGVLADEQLDTDADDADVAVADVEEPVDDESDRSLSREQDAVDEDTDQADVAELDPVDTGGADEPDRAVLADEPEIETGPGDRTPESDHPRERLAPVGPDAAIDPGTGSYEDRWGAIQAGFIDDPRRTAESAGSLMAEIWDDIARAITDEREAIDARWHATQSSTDDLRGAMQDYRALYARFMRFTSD